MAKKIEVPTQIVKQSHKKSGHIVSLCNSLIEGYARKDLAVHIRVRGNGKGREFCICVNRGERPKEPTLPIDVNNFEIGGSVSRAQIGQNDTPVLVEVCEFVKDPKEVFLPVISQPARLQVSDLCNCIEGDSLQASGPFAMPFDCVFKNVSSGAGADGKTIVFSGFFSFGQNKLPYQIVEGGPEVLQTIPGDQGHATGKAVFRLEGRDDRIRCALLLGHQFARIALEIPAHFGSKFLEVLVCPVHLLSDRIGNGHRES